MTDKIVLYTALICPYAQRAAIALREAGVEYESVEIDLTNKPSWYKDVNPELKVPALSIKGKSIAESLVLVELANDLHPEKGLLPEDPVKRAEVRFVIEYFSSKITPLFYFVLRNMTEEGKKEYVEKITIAYKRLNELLLEQAASGPYFLGDQYSLADIAIAPFLTRVLAVQKAYLKDIKFDVIDQSPRLQQFFEGLLTRSSHADTYCGDNYLIDGFVSRWGLYDPRV
ncbi:glutathione s-transferase c-terminal-likeprotein [Lichtheimia corymbifera JMRC:FSU:9682]|uniref:Glutathione s-transferase c-terminal-likeprotein n=1 Tax=Lichtheimia corymbifera JMRC:FSU:9682 TaxID=1263082 RepID=A0A068SC34_9FUNG|nr:glutathione s-transferase c-terminal-likeprotein [Lichtheimia corymbifera JMRC:FSU:9682]